ncbi:MAG: T9SS type A sorting domain-containing protein [Saprospiraceae bacterium]|nr:T9SS type A sorting domain-containing protein [Saprospiraceae bacterium]
MLISFIYSINFSIYAQNPFKAPLSWSVYENNLLQEQAGVADNYISENDFQKNIDWVDQNLKPYGYNLICLDGWGDATQLTTNGYRKSHSRNWMRDYAWWSTYLQSKTLRLGMYDNPLWVHVNPTDSTTKIVGTNIPVSSLINTAENASLFKWVQVNRSGAEVYVKGCIKYYANLGIKYLRVDFLSWFETGMDKNLGRVGVNRPRADYEKALRWMREACDSNGVFLSLVMPNLTNEAAAEKKYGHSMRINEDVGTGGWERFSNLNKGTRFSLGSQYENPMDGFAYWSSVSGRDSVILEGDFIRLNTFKNDNEKRTVISAYLMAGAPLSIADQYNTIGDNIWLYQNSEVLFLNADKFVGKPLSNNPTDERSEIWTGQMSTGNWFIGMFNRSETTRTRTIAFSSLGITEPINVRDLWQYGHLGKMKELTADIPPHGCLMVKLAATPITCPPLSVTFDSIPTKFTTALDFSPSATSNIGQPINFEIASGPATIVNNKVHLTGVNGTVYVVAKQQITTNHCVALPQVRFFKVVTPNAVQNTPNEPTITLSPNPVQTVLTVNCSESMDKVYLVDLVGRKVLSKIIYAPTTSLDVSLLPKGMYCLRIFRGDNVFVKKIFIQ